MNVSISGGLTYKARRQRLVDMQLTLNVERLRGNPVSLISGRQKSFWAGQKLTTRATASVNRCTEHPLVEELLKV